MGSGASDYLVAGCGSGVDLLSLEPRVTFAVSVMLADRDSPLRSAAGVKSSRRRLPCVVSRMAFGAVNGH
jgi:hypothetical protein